MASAGEEFAFSTSSGGGFSSPPTLPDDMNDADDATGGYVHADGDSVTIDTADWTFGATLDTFTLAAGDTIDFVRHRVRAKREDLSGPPPAPGTASVQPAMGAIAVGAVEAVTEVEEWHDTDFATHPVDLTEWTAAGINGSKWGWKATAVTLSAISQTECWLTEFAVEVWGTLGTVEEIEFHQATVRAGERTTTVRL
jgi:hypothetical protein